MKFETWRDESGRRMFSGPVALVLGLAVATLACGIFHLDPVLGTLIFPVVVWWAATRPIAEGAEGDRLTRAALYASFVTLAALFAYGRLF